MGQSLRERDAKCIWHPFTQMQTAPAALGIVRGAGAYLFAENGAAYLDAISSWWVNLHGHAHPHISARIAEQLEQLEHVIFAGMTHAPAVELAEKLLAIAPGAFARVFYSDNGSTAVETALKIVIQFRRQNNRAQTRFLCLKHSYHGDTFGAMSAADRTVFNRPFWSYLFAVEALEPPLKGFEARFLEELQSKLQEGTYGGFIYEPLILGAGGMRIYSAQAMNEALVMCRKADVLLIADEVMTGFGRTGPLFASERLSEKPDLICLSKGLTGGFLPLGATLATQAIYEGFLSSEKERAFLHGHSYTANPLCCTAALANLDLLLNPVCKAQRATIAQCHAQFCQRYAVHPRLLRCESLGTILALEYRSAQNSEEFARRLTHFFLAEGILIRPLGKVLYLLPPYCITPLELERIYSIIAQTLEWTDATI